jgi:hypothetical protein
MNFPDRCCANCTHVQAFAGWIECNLIPEQRSTVVSSDGEVQPDDRCAEHDFAEVA